MRQLYRADKHASDFKPTGKCLNCLGSLPKRHRKYCSFECSEEFYNREVAPHIFDWNVIRKQVLRRDGHECVKCGSRAKEVDHIIAIVNGGSEFDKSNLQSMCHPCHANKTGRDRKTANLQKKVTKRKTEHEDLSNYCEIKAQESRTE